MKLDLANFPKHNWVVKKDTSQLTDKQHFGGLKWAKLHCPDCGIIIDCFFKSEAYIDVYYKKGEPSIKIIYRDDVELIKEKLLTCSELIIKNIIE